MNTNDNMTRLKLLQWACQFSHQLPSNRRDLCYDTSKRAFKELTHIGWQVTLVYAEQGDGFPHWFLTIKVDNEVILLDFTASQFSNWIYPPVCLGTYKQLSSRFRRYGKQPFWKILGTDAQTYQESWQKKYGFN